MEFGAPAVSKCCTTRFCIFCCVVYSFGLVCFFEIHQVLGGSLLNGLANFAAHTYWFDHFEVFGISFCLICQYLELSLDPAKFDIIRTRCSLNGNQTYEKKQNWYRNNNFGLTTFVRAQVRKYTNG